MWHSELVKLSPIKINIKSDVLESKYSKPNDPKPPYVVLEIDGGERSYNCENNDCAAFFDNRKGQTISICAEGSREDARIVLVGEEVRPPVSRPAASAPAARPAANVPVSRPAHAPTEHASGVGMRAGEVRYERTVGLPNYCSEKIGITVFLEEGAKAAEALAYAKKFVESHLQSPEKR